MKKEKNLFGAVSSVMVIMILSRLLSLLSVQIYMAFYGAGDERLNIYSFAISIPNIIFTCIGTALSTVVIPIYAGHIAKNETREAKRFADNIISISLLLTLALVLIGIGISPILPKFTAFAENERTYSFAVKALMAIMPVMFFYALNYIFQGMLQALGRYNLPAFVSVPSSLVVIGYVFLLGDRFKIPGLLIATLIGLSLQAIILIPPLIMEGYRYRPSLEFKDRDIILAGKMTVPVLLGVGAYQLNMLYNVTMIARFEGMVTLLNYVQNITLYLVLALVYSVTAVLYPRLTKSAASGDMGEYKATLSGTLESMCAILIPLSFGFIGVRKSLLELIAAWGRITQGDIDKAAGLLFMYAIGVLGIGFKEILDRSFYSLGDTKTSAVNGVVIMGVNVALSLVLINFIGPYGIPLAYSAASLTGTGVLLFRLKKKIGSYAPNLGKTAVKCVIASAAMLGIITVINTCLGGLTGGESLKSVILVRAAKLLAPFFAGVISYAGLCVVLRIAPATEFMGKFLKRGGR